MKKRLITAILAIAGIYNVHGQSVLPPLVQYKPVYANPSQSDDVQPSHHSLPGYSAPKPQENFSNVAGYYVSGNQLVRVKIRVSEVTFRGSSSLYVVGYYDRRDGSFRSTQGQASKISQWGFDKNFYNDFEWKASISLGTVYFNY